MPVPTRRRPFSARKAVAALGAFAALAVGVPLATATPAAAAAGCQSSGCTGKNPATMGCAADARTIASVSAPGGGGYAELRYSPACNAAWARQLPDSDPVWRVRIQGSSSNDGTPDVTYIDGSNAYYTLMVSYTWYVRAGAEQTVTDPGAWNNTSWR
ncbi:hypothetical protein GCM10020367_58730 [Streptomyces sannanensis]|uniref:DUF2690 domain-containing protein n=1 Tax=Streptomyces sannanensis TaxID=285536 RepID=A0ABP6SKC8_9ACTN